MGIFCRQQSHPGSVLRRNCKPNAFPRHNTNSCNLIIQSGFEKVYEQCVKYSNAYLDHLEGKLCSSL